MSSDNRLSRIGNIALGVAAIGAVGAVGYTVHRHRSAPGVTTTAAAQTAKTAPLNDLQQQVRDHPDDVAAWRALGTSQMDTADYSSAVTSFRHATALDATNAEGWSALGEALVMASPRDPMPADALASFKKAKAIDGKDPRARYFLAVSKDLSGDHKGAIADWLALLKDTPDGAPWEADLKRTIEQVGKINGIPVTDRLAALEPVAAQPSLPDKSLAAAAIPGPSPEQMHAAAALSPQQQSTMIDGMVASLESKLAADPSNVAGWVMLMRSRMTLNQPAKAAKALKDAIAANPARAQRLKQEAAVLNVPSI